MKRRRHPSLPDTPLPRHGTAMDQPQKRHGPVLASPSTQHGNVMARPSTSHETAIGPSWQSLDVATMGRWWDKYWSIVVPRLVVPWTRIWEVVPQLSVNQCLTAITVEIPLLSYLLTYWPGHWPMLASSWLYQQPAMKPPWTRVGHAILVQPWTSHDRQKPDALQMFTTRLRGRRQMSDEWCSVTNEIRRTHRKALPLWASAKGDKLLSSTLYWLHFCFRSGQNCFYNSLTDNDAVSLQTGKHVSKMRVLTIESTASSASCTRK